MSLDTLTLVYRGNADRYALDVKFDDRRVLRHTFAGYGTSKDISNLASYDECLRDAILGALINAGTFDLTVTGAGGNLTVTGAGGNVTLDAGSGGAGVGTSTGGETAANAGAGATIEIAGGDGGDGTSAGAVDNANAGAGGGARLVAGTGGTGADGAGGPTNGVGGLAEVIGGAGGDGTAGTAAGAGGNVEINGGDAGADGGGGGANSGGVTVDAGAPTGAGTAGTVSIGTGNATAIEVGRAASTTLIHGTVSLTNSLRAFGAIAADSQLNADVIGAATEAAHTSVSLAQALLNTARTRFRFRAMIEVVSSNGADTWRIRLRLGGLAGVLIADSGAISIANGNLFTIEGELQIRSIGVVGTFTGYARLFDPVGAAFQEDSVVGGAVDTTAARDLVVTGECSTADPGNQVRLNSFSVESWAE